MAGGKKKKKPASNPARGFATTSVASKPRTDIEPASESTTDHTPEVTGQENQQATALGAGGPSNITVQNDISPEEFEKQLEENELQQLVEKHAQKAKRDAARQKTRLETERRVLRSQAETLSTRKWLPAELMEEILDLIQGEGRSNQGTDTSTKQVPEEDLVIRLWTLKQALIGAGFMEEKVALTIREILGQSDKISGSNKDVIWGLEEALDWLARECSRDELPGYDHRYLPKSSNGQFNHL